MARTKFTTLVYVTLSMRVGMVPILPTIIHPNSMCCHSFIGHDVAQNICTFLDSTAICHVQNVVMTILFRLRVRAKTKLPSNLNNKSFADGSVKSNAHAEIADWLDIPENRIFIERLVRKTLWNISLFGKSLALWLEYFAGLALNNHKKIRFIAQHLYWHVNWQ